jgi:hypothetical protein
MRYLSNSIRDHLNGWRDAARRSFERRQSIGEDDRRRRSLSVSSLPPSTPLARALSGASEVKTNETDRIQDFGSLDESDFSDEDHDWVLVGSAPSPPLRRRQNIRNAPILRLNAYCMDNVLRFLSGSTINARCTKVCYSWRELIFFSDLSLDDCDFPVPDGGNRLRSPRKFGYATPNDPWYSDSLNHSWYEDERSMLRNDVQDLSRSIGRDAKSRRYRQKASALKDEAVKAAFTERPFWGGAVHGAYIGVCMGHMAFVAGGALSGGVLAEVRHAKRRRRRRRLQAVAAARRRVEMERAGMAIQRAFQRHRNQHPERWERSLSLHSVLQRVQTLQNNRAHSSGAGRGAGAGAGARTNL